MALDQFQVRDFDQHWAGTLAAVNGDMAQVLGAYSAEKMLASVNRLTGEGTAEKQIINMNDIEIPKIEMGFYDIGNHPCLFSRLPTTQTKKGIYSRNAALKSIYIDGGSVMGETLPLTWDRMLYVWNESKSPKKADPDKLTEALDLLLQGFYRGLTLNRDYCLMYHPKAGAPSPIAVCGLSGIVGRIINKDEIVIRPAVRYVWDSVKEALGERFGINPKEAKNVR